LKTKNSSKDRKSQTEKAKKKSVKHVPFHGGTLKVVFFNFAIECPFADCERISLHSSRCPQVKKVLWQKATREQLPEWLQSQKPNLPLNK